MADGKEIIEKQTKLIVPSTTKGRYQVVIVEGRGALLKDADGKEYIDLHAGYATVNLGHCHPRVVQAIKDQAEKIWHVSWDFYLVPTALLAEKLIEITPKKLRKVLFCSCGAEAVENAVKFAKKFVVKSMGKTGAQIISLAGSFHGRTSYAMALTGQKKYKDGLGTYVHPFVVHAPSPYCYRCPFGMKHPDCGLYCVDYLEDLIKFHTFGDVAAFISEPIMGEGGIIIPPDDYLSKVVKKLRDHEILYIADEIQTGFCRTGKMFAVEWYGVEPDIMTVGKGIASGLPIAATLISDEISEVLSPIDHCSTYGGNALVCAAGLENIKILMEERYDERALKLGSLFLERLKEIAERQEMIGDVRGKGLMIGVELVKDKEKKVPAPDLAEAVRLEAQKRGVLLNTGGVHGCVLRIQPPIAITEEQAERALNVIEDSMRAVR